MTDVSSPALTGFQHVYSGKVRDLYAPLDDAGQVIPGQLMLVASDRISAYDFILDTPIPDKGEVLTRLSLWWFDQLADLVPNHVLSTDVPKAVAGRAVIVRKLEMLQLEAIARAYLTGGGLEEYRASGTVSGITLPTGLEDGSRLAEPIFTPSTKAPFGQHDLPMTPPEVTEALGAELAAEVSEVTRAILARGNEIAAERGILIADTKVEFGRAPGGGSGSGESGSGDSGAGGLILADEVLTPDSSRFWPADQWEPGRSQPSYDKQFVRDWLTSPESGWSRSSGEAPPALPEHVVAQTRAKYVEAYERLTGESF